MKTAHTPGKWDAHKCYILDEYGNKVAVACPEKHLGQGDTEYNARLIAAAPELLAALQTLLTRCNSLDQSATHDGLANLGAMVQARLAIAKAVSK